MIYYSDSQKGFFDSDLHSIIPEDAIEIRKEDHFDLVEWASTSNQKLSVKNGKVIKDYDEEKRKQNIKPGVDSIRDIRNYALAKSDIKVLPDYQITDEEREMWKVFRQKLRDLPATADDEIDEDGYLINFSMPKSPSSEFDNEILRYMGTKPE